MLYSFRYLHRNPGASVTLKIFEFDRWPQALILPVFDRFRFKARPALDGGSNGLTRISKLPAWVSLQPAGMKKFRS